MRRDVRTVLIVIGVLVLFMAYKTLFWKTTGGGGGGYQLSGNTRYRTPILPPAHTAGGGGVGAGGANLYANAKPVWEQQPFRYPTNELSLVVGVPMEPFAPFHVRDSLAALV